MVSADIASLGANETPDDDDENEPRRDDERAILPSRIPSLVAEVVETEGWPAAADLIERIWDRFATTASAHLLTAIQELPGAAFVERPALLAGANYLQHLAAGGESSRFSNANVVDAAMGGNNIGLLDALVLLTTRAADARTSGDIAAAHDAAQRALALLKRSTEAERVVVRTPLPHMRVQWARSLEDADDPAAGFEYEEAYHGAIVTRQTVIARRAAAQRAWMHASRGRLNAAELWLTRSLEGPSMSGRYDGVVYLTRALLLLERGDPEAAAREMARVEALGEGEYWAATLWVRSLIAHGSSAATIVEARLVHQVERHPVSTEGANGRYLRSARARLAALRGRSLGTSVEPRRNPTSTDLLIEGEIAQGNGRHHDALDALRPATNADEPPRVQACALLLTAAASLALDRRESAAAAFVQAHALIESERLRTAYECVSRDELVTLAALAGVTLPSIRWVSGGSRTSGDLLSTREREVLHQLASSRSMSEIAAALFVSPNTLKSTVRRVYRKLGVESRGAAVDAGRAAGLV